MRKFTLNTIETLFAMQIVHTTNRAESSKEPPYLDIDSIVARQFLIQQMLEGSLTEDNLHYELILEESMRDLLLETLDIFKDFCEFIATEEADAHRLVTRIINLVKEGELVE